MNQSIVLTILFSLFIGFQIQAQNNITGVWKTIDDDGETIKSHVEIYEKEGKFYGKVIKLFREPDEEQNPKCLECKDHKKDQPIIGMEILSKMEKEEDSWEGGKIMDPENGKYYSCQMELMEPDKLKVRGYIGFSLIGRNQYWHRIN